VELLGSFKSALEWRLHGVIDELGTDEVRQPAKVALALALLDESSY